MGKYSKKKRKHSKRYYIAKVQRAAICMLIVILSIMITSISQRVKYEKLIDEISDTELKTYIRISNKIKEKLSQIDNKVGDNNENI